jgi:hypothetical protein
VFARAVLVIVSNSSNMASSAETLYKVHTISNYSLVKIAIAVLHNSRHMYALFAATPNLYNDSYSMTDCVMVISTTCSTVVDY